MEYRFRKKDEAKEKPPPMRTFVPKSASMTMSRSRLKRRRNTLILSILLLLAVLVVISLTLLNLAKSDKEIPRRAPPLAQKGQKNTEPSPAQNRTEPNYSILSLLKEDGLIDAYVDAATTKDREALRSISSTQSSGQIRWNGKLHDYTLTKRLPNLMRLELKSGDSITTYGHDGKSYWREVKVAEVQTESAPASTAETSALRQIAKFYDPILAYALEGAGIIQVIEVDEWRETSALRVQLRGTSLSRVDIYLEPKTLEILATVEKPRNSEVEHTTIFSDYRLAKGIRTPFSIENSLGDKLKYKLSLNTFTLNPEVASSHFSAPDPL